VPAVHVMVFALMGGSCCVCHLVSVLGD
jgi:hypothetical protein